MVRVYAITAFSLGHAHIFGNRSRRVFTDALTFHPKAVSGRGGAVRMMTNRDKDTRLQPGTVSKTVSPGGMTAHSGRLRVKIAMRGRKDDGSSREPAKIVGERALPPSPPNTSPPQTGQELRTASLPFAAFEMNCRVWPLKRTALLGNPMKGMNPEPEALRQSAQ